MFKQVRCPKCNKLLFMWKARTAKVSIKCSRCKHIVMVESKTKII